MWTDRDNVVNPNIQDQGCYAYHWFSRKLTFEIPVEVLAFLEFLRVEKKPKLAIFRVLSGLDVPRKSYKTTTDSANQDQCTDLVLFIVLPNLLLHFLRSCRHE